MSEYVGGADQLDGFPVSDYYANNIKEARTISRSGSWWSAVLLIQDPKTKRLFLKFYRWQKRNNNWKVAQSFSINSKRDICKAINFLEEFNRLL